MSEAARLCIFARAPVAGEVKTRLIPALGAAGALAAHQELVSLALSQLADVSGLRSELWIAGALDHPGVIEWSGRWRLPVFAQRGSDLGARMHHAIESCLQQRVSGMVVGTDCPAITASYVQQACRLLAEHDLVLGPAEDGGYGLVGLRTPAPELFADMPWGTDRVLEETLRRARTSGLQYRLLDTIWDVDGAEDWVRFRAGG